MKPKNPKAYDILGSVAIVRFPKEFKQKEKKKFASKLLKNQKPIKTVLEKYGKIKGRLRKIQTRYLAGEKTKEVLYKENNCVFRFNIDTTYFSPRLSNERKEIAQEIKKGQEVLVMFAGVSPYSIVIAKNSKAKKVYSNEINREANKYAELNIQLNKLKDKVELIQGDVKKIVKRGFPPPRPHSPHRRSL
jgi:tRNA (guanine37-N1)-methyltransferase